MKRGHAAIRTSSPSGATADFFPGDIGRRQSPRTSASAYASARNRDGFVGDLLTPTLSFLSGSLAAGAKLTAAAGAGAEGDGGGRVAGRSAGRLPCIHVFSHVVVGGWRCWRSVCGGAAGPGVILRPRFCGGGDSEGGDIPPAAQVRVRGAAAWACEVRGLRWCSSCLMLPGPWGRDYV
jgi:hypothetical protein